ncbi:hypothetical protein B5S33_g4103 [[Candida] boidinii]|nr:hypothetical protein B5S30_g2973 [[Candida] boidinii]OWB85436.1 hypothetical protein B5S33_g4103 [[Candida] boidinii]
MKSDLHNYIEQLIAQYLISRNYTETLKNLEIESETPLKQQTSDLEETLESIIEDRTKFINLKNRNEINSTNSGLAKSSIYTPHQLSIIESKKLIIPNWSVEIPNTIDNIKLENHMSSLVIYSNYARLKISDTNDILNVGLFLTTDKTLFIHDLDENKTILSHKNINGLSTVSKTVTAIENTDFILVAGMNGSLIISKLVKSSSISNYDLMVLKEIKIHKSLITAMKYLKIDDNSGYLCSIGWDTFVNVHKILIDDNGEISIKAFNGYKLMTNATSIETIYHDSLPVILVGRIESSLLSVLYINDAEDDVNSNVFEICKISLNDSEFSTHAFHPMSIANLVSSNLITIGTNHIPYMRLITVHLPSMGEILGKLKEKGTTEIVFNEEINDYKSVLLKIGSEIELKQSFTATIPIFRDSIISNLNSMAPQDKYSSALIFSRSDLDSRKGLWIIGDDGIIRGYDLSTGKTVIELKTDEGRIKSAFIGCNKYSKELIVSCGAMSKQIKIWV